LIKKKKKKRISHAHDLDHLSKTQLENGDLGFDAWDLKSFLFFKKSNENIFTYEEKIKLIIKLHPARN